jgi:hypothetical protein
MRATIQFSLRLAAIALLLSVAATGCRKAGEAAAEAAIERASDGKLEVDRDGDVTTLRGEDGSQMRMSTGDDLTLPVNFPRDVYLPREYALNSVVEMGPVTMVQLSSTQTVSDLYASADQAMQAHGWKQVMAMRQASGSAVLGFEKEQRRASLTFSSGASDGRTVVGVQLQAAAH